MTDKTPIENPFASQPEFNCFVCSPNHQQGFRLNFFKQDDWVCSETQARDDLTGVPGILHGGIQSTLLDEIMWWAVFNKCNRFCLSQNLVIDFKAAVRSQTDLKLRGQVIETEKNLVKTVGEIRDEKTDRLLVKASGLYFLPSRSLLARALGLKPDDIPPGIAKYLS